MAVFNLLKAVAVTVGILSIPVLGQTTTTATCNTPCVPPIATVTSVTTISPTRVCPTATIPTSTCTDNILTNTRSITMVIDCLPPVFVPYTRCPQTTTAWVTAAIPIPCISRPTPTVVECPYATATTVTTSIVTLGGPCIPRRTSTLSPVATDLLPTCTPTPTGIIISKYGQCGGYNFLGGTCIAGTTCTVLNEWYSQCL